MFCVWGAVFTKGQGFSFAVGETCMAAPVGEMIGEVISAIYSLGGGPPGPAVVPPMAASALLKKVAMFCSLEVGGSPPT